MALLDDIKEVVGAEAFAKLEASGALKTRLQKGDELFGFYAGEVDDPPANSNNPPPPTTGSGAPPNPFDLSGVEKMLERRLGTLETTIKKELDTKITAAVTEYTKTNQSMATQVLQQADQLNRVYLRHNREFGEEFDSKAFAEWNAKPENAHHLEEGKPVGNRFNSVMESYEAWTAERRRSKEIDAEVNKRLKERSGSTGLPGNTPPPATNTNILRLMRRGGTDGADHPATAADRAAAALEKLVAGREQAAG